MDTTEARIEQVTVSELLELATWDRTRTDDELHDFITRRSSLVGL